MAGSASLWMYGQSILHRHVGCWIFPYLVARFHTPCHTCSRCSLHSFQDSLFLSLDPSSVDPMLSHQKSVISDFDSWISGWISELLPWTNCSSVGSGQSSSSASSTDMLFLWTFCMPVPFSGNGNRLAMLGHCFAGSSLADFLDLLFRDTSPSSLFLAIFFSDLSPLSCLVLLGRHISSN